MWKTINLVCVLFAYYTTCCCTVLLLEHQNFTHVNSPRPLYQCWPFLASSEEPVEPPVDATWWPATAKQNLLLITCKYLGLERWLLAGWRLDVSRPLVVHKMVEWLCKIEWQVSALSLAFCVVSLFIETSTCCRNGFRVSDACHAFTTCVRLSAVHLLQVIQVSFCCSVSFWCRYKFRAAQGHTFSIVTSHILERFHVRWWWRMNFCTESRRC